MNVFVFAEGGRCGLMDVGGETVLEARYEALGPSCEGLISFEENDRWGVMDYCGEIVHPPVFTSIESMDGDAIVVKSGAFHGVLLRSGRLSCACDRLIKLGRFSHGLAPAALGLEPEYGYVNLQGEFVMQARFKSAGDFWEDRAAVKNADGKYGFIGHDGEVKVPFEYSLVYRFSEGLAAVAKGKAADRYGFVAPDGMNVLKPRWNGADLRFSEGLACVWKDEKHGFIDCSGNLVIEYIFDFAEHFSCGLCLCSIERRGKPAYGFVNHDGKWVIEPRFDDADAFKNGLASVTERGWFGYIDVNGKWIRRTRDE